MVDHWENSGSEAPVQPANELTTVRLRRTLLAAPERVWQALTDPAELEAWFWPPSLAPKVRCDARPDGEVRIESVAMALSGRFREVQPPHRLVFTWTWDGEALQTLVTIGLSAVDNATDLTLAHEGFPDQASRDDHVKGWSDCLDRLPARLVSER